MESPRSLGVISATDRPFWLGADPVVDAVLESARVVDPDLEPMYLKNRPAVTVPSLEPNYNALSGSAPSPGSARRIRHLVVLPGGREE